jgi:hypothetical protein
MFQDGLSSLTDIELAADKQPFVLEYGTWTGGFLLLTQEVWYAQPKDTTM